MALIARFTGGPTNRPGRLIVRGNGSLEPALTPAPTTTSTTTPGAPPTTLTTTTTTSSTTSSEQPSTTSSSTTTTSEKPTTTKPDASTTTSTKPAVSTTVTTTSSTTTTTDSCAGLPDGIGCPPDENPWTADVCVGGTCTHDTPQGSFVTCRPANGTPCDVEDHCGGTTCPDMKKLAGQVCTPLVAAHPCNLGDFLRCDGVHEYCPSERLCDNAAECSADEQCFSHACYQGVCIDRASAGGPCDSAPDCADGLTCNSGTCVTDTATDCMGLAAGTVCRPAVDTCDVAESCTGESSSCPPDTFSPANTPCRLNQGGCDLADVCTGTFAGCPDRIADAGAPCGSPLVGPCHPVQETCNGVSKACPTPVYVPCQPSQGPCDIVDSCDPATNPNFPDCPPTRSSRMGLRAGNLRPIVRSASVTASPTRARP